MITSEMVEKAKSQADEAVNALAEIKKQYAIQECPLSVGEKTEIKGWAHKGKMMLITYIGPAKHGFQGSWIVSGKVIKKCGGIGEQDAEFCEVHYNGDIKEWE